MTDGMETLSHEERMRLMKFVCSFAWTDLRVSAEEKVLIEKLVRAAGFDDKERAQVARWVEVPPPADEVDPTTVPLAHRQLFLDVARAVVEADGRVVPAERDSLRFFRELLG